MTVITLDAVCRYSGKVHTSDSHALNYVGYTNKEIQPVAAGEDAVSIALRNLLKDRRTANEREQRMGHINQPSSEELTHFQY